MASRSLLCVLVVLLGLVAPQAMAAGVGGTELFVEVATPSYALSPAGITVPGYVLNQLPGAPALPVHGIVIELPPTGEWTLEVSGPGARVLPQQVMIYPAPTPVASPPEVYGIDALRTGGDLRSEEKADPAIYGRDALYPESIAVAGTEQWQRGKRLLPIQVFPFQYNPVTLEVVYHANIKVTVRVAEGARAAESVRDGSPVVSGMVSQSNEAELGALLLRTGQRGMHRLNYSDLSTVGVPVSTVDPDSFLVTYLGQPVQIQVTGGADGHFDPPNSNIPGDLGDLVIFYAEPYTGRWMASNVYRFSYGTSAAPASTRMSTRTVTPTGSEPVVTTGKQTQHIEVNSAYYSDFDISVEADHIFDNPVYPQPATPLVVWPYDITLDDPIMSGSMTISAQLYGGQDVGTANPDEWAKLQVNSHDVATYTWDGRTPYSVLAASVPMIWLDQVVNKLNFVGDLSKLPGISSYWYYLDYADITYPAALDAEGDRIEVQNPDTTGTSVRLKVTGFTAATVRAYDVRDPRNPVQLMTMSSAPINGATEISLWDAWANGAAKPAYSLTTDAVLLAPTAIEIDQPSFLKSTSNYADYIAIVHRSLWSAVQPLLDRRMAQGLKVAKVDVQDIYDEFNFGHLHQYAIRNFLQYAYENWNQGGPRPKYVVMVGDATPDYKGQLVSTLKNLVPAFLIDIDPWIKETTSDNRFVTFDGPADFMPEMTIGRISAQDAPQLTNYVDKVLSYEDKSATPDGAWQNRVVYVADDDSNYAGNFNALSESVRLSWLPPLYQSTAVYFNLDNNPPGGYQTGSDMRINIKKAFDNSAVFLQWFGHASRFRWGDAASMWNINDPPTLNPNTMAPFVAAFSCWDGYFINMDSNYASLAEKHVLQQGRGAIGALSPSGKHIGSALSVLDQGLTKSFFQDRKGPIGDATDAAKLFYYANSSSYMDVIDTSILFGDPVLQLRLSTPVSTPDAPYVNIERNAGTSADLMWDHVGVDAAYYEVYRSTQPYPAIGVSPTNRIMDIAAGTAYGSGYTFVKLDNGTDQYPADGTAGPVQPVGDPAVNYFWVIQSRSSGGVTSGVLNTVGEFDFALAKGN